MKTKLFFMLCETCEHLIASPEEGLVEFICEPNGSYRNFRVVHKTFSSPFNNHRGCSIQFYKENGSEKELTEFAGVNKVQDVIDVLDEFQSNPNKSEYVKLFNKLNQQGV